MVLRFADCELDLDRVVLRRAGDEVRIEPQAFDLLAYLVARRGTMVRKEQLLDDVWGDRFVSESALTTRIKAVRQAVGDNGNRQAIIRTVHGKGYEFVAAVESDDADGVASPAAPVTGLGIALAPLIGRDAQLADLIAALSHHRLITLSVRAASARRRSRSSSRVRSRRTTRTVCTSSSSCGSSTRKRPPRRSPPRST